MFAEQFSFAALWSASDNVGRGVALLLLTMSVTSWYLIILRVAGHIAQHRTQHAIEAFWSAPDLPEGLQRLAAAGSSSAYAQLAARSANAAAHYDQHTAESQTNRVDRSEFLVRAMRQSIAHSSARLESGLGALASIGSTAPFIGLFGTVWGIYHALQRISETGSASLDKVAGPVGEALIMTAAGLFVAIPAVLAYNAAVRSNRLQLARLDGFAHELHAFLTTGARLPPEHP